jgi:hypothetical protein
MGINVYGRYDELVIELSGWDRLRTGRSEVRIDVDDVWFVRAADAADLVTLADERVFRTGVRRRGPVLVMELREGAPFDRLVLTLEDAASMAADLRRWGVGQGSGLASAGASTFTG